MKRIISCCLLVLAIGCMNTPQSTPAPSAATHVSTSAATWADVDSRVKADPDIESIIKPYRDQLYAEMNRVIGTAENDLVRGRPESTLGNFVCDVLLDTARKFTQVDCAITNAGGLRAPIFKGDITIGSIFQLMPFENRVVVAEYSGKDFVAMIQEIAEKGGCPLAGLTIVSTGGIVTAYVGEQEVVDHKRYRVATIDYLLKGGGNLETPARGKLVEDTGVLLREALITYVQEKKNIAVSIEGRMVIQ